MDTQGTGKRFTSALNFRVTAKLAADVMEHQNRRGLEKISDAARELVTLGAEMAPLMAEARALDIDPVAALRAAIADKISKP